MYCTLWLPFEIGLQNSIQFGFPLIDRSLFIASYGSSYGGLDILLPVFFCQLVAKPGDVTATPPWSNPYVFWRIESPLTYVMVPTWHQSIVCYTPCFNEVKTRVYWFHLVHLSICEQNCVCSVSFTILVRSISYLCTLSSNFQRCAMCKFCFKIDKFKILASYLNL